MDEETRGRGRPLGSKTSYSVSQLRGVLATGGREAIKALLWLMAKELTRPALPRRRPEEIRSIIQMWWSYASVLGLDIRAEDATIENVNKEIRKLAAETGMVIPGQPPKRVIEET